MIQRSITPRSGHPKFRKLRKRLQYKNNKEERIIDDEEEVPAGEEELPPAGDQIPAAGDQILAADDQIPPVDEQVQSKCQRKRKKKVICVDT